MIRVLFVCMGNICRSPMAEAVFREYVKQEGLDDRIETDSAGTGHWHVGKPPHRGTLEELRKNGISGEDLRARQVAKEDLQRFDYIVAMDEHNLAELRRLERGERQSKPMLLLQLVPEIEDPNVPDPYFEGNFSHVYELVSKGCKRLLDYIKKEQGWKQ